jgi:lipopolysaccharide export LptBFGC system permease protein LptF
MMRSMADLERRSPSRLSRRQREQRAYQLTLATAGLAVVAVVGFVLAVVGVVGGTIPFLAAVLAVVCGLLLRRTLSKR